ncbi:MAG: hypothetical protein ACLUT1_04645 [Ruminococcus sp.]|nr:DUF3343 domain-containing protein [Ruminococcus sp.]
MMLTCKAAMQSYTQAMKAQKLLGGYGYRSEIRRKEKNAPGGCGYVLVVKGDCSSVSDILLYGGIPYQDVQSGREAP